MTAPSLPSPRRGRGRKLRSTERSSPSQLRRGQGEGRRAERLDSRHDVFLRLLGGIDASYRVSTRVELLDPATREWTEVSSMADARFAHRLTMLAGGAVVATGGASLSSSGAFVPFASAESFVQPPVPPLPVRGRLAP